MAAPTWVAAGAKTEKPSDVGTTSSVAPPAGHAANDLLVIAANSFQAVTTSTPSGWTLLGSAVNWGPGISSYLFWKLATSSSEPSVTLTTSAGAYHDSQMYAFRGVDQTIPVDATVVFGTVGGTGVSNVAVPALTTVTNTALMVVTGCSSSEAGWTTPPAGATQRVLTSMYVTGMCLATEVKTTAGTEAADVYVRSGAGGAARTAAFAVRPVGAAAPTFVPQIIIS